MKRSETINNLTTALAQAQGAFKPAIKSGTNPHLKNRYATLDDVIAAVREPLQKNGLSFIQPLTGDGEEYLLETILFHESGEWIGCESVIPSSAGNRGVNELQAFGGSLTYMRRYMLTALLGISSDEDKDGNGNKPAQKKTPAKKASAKQKPAAQAPKPSLPHWIDRVTEDGRPIMKAFWAWATGNEEGQLGLSDAQVHKALEVESVRDFKGTMQEAKAKIEKWLADELDPNS